MQDTNERVFFKAEHISVSYSSRKVLKDISFSIDSSNSLIGLVGANGCGKTTLLKAICNQLPHEGTFTLYNRPLEKLSPRELARSLSYIPQRSGIQISISVLDMVLMGFNPILKLLESPSDSMRKSALNALNMAGAAHLANQDYLTLSEGEKQLCVLARTLVQNTPLMLLDEPDSALDFHNKYSMMKTVRHVTELSGKAAMICLHDPMLALDFCDQLILIKDGSILTSIFPKKDSADVIEAAFLALYDNITVKEATDRSGNRRLVLISEI